MEITHQKVNFVGCYWQKIQHIIQRQINFFYFYMLNAKRPLQLKKKREEKC